MAYKRVQLEDDFGRIVRIACHKEVVRIRHVLQDELPTASSKPAYRKMILALTARASAPFDRGGRGSDDLTGVTRDPPLSETVNARASSKTFSSPGSSSITMSRRSPGGLAEPSIASSTFSMAAARTHSAAIARIATAADKARTR